MSDVFESKSHPEFDFSDYDHEVAVVYELNHLNNEQGTDYIRNFLSYYLYERQYYYFYNLTINVPYPNTFFSYGFSGDILEYGQGIDYHNLNKNVWELDIVGQHGLASASNIADGLRYIYSDRKPGKYPTALLIIGDSDVSVKDPVTIQYLNMLKNQTSFVTMAVSFGGDFSSLVDEPRYYHKVDGTSIDSQRKAADQIAIDIAYL